MMDSNDNNSKTEATAESAAEVPKTDLEMAQEDAAKWKNEFLYLKAEFENYKRNALKERSELLKFGAERVSRDILDVVDNFERALQTKLTAESLQNYKVGVEMTAKELKEVLAKHGIQEVLSEGQPFNPLYHEAISSEPTDSVPAGHIARVFKKPYKLHDKIIRMGQVVVASPPNNTNGQG